MGFISNNLWERKHLILDFAISDLKIRYRNSVLGFVWTFLEPLLLLSVLYIVFTNIFKSQIEFFPLYLLLGLILWNMLVRGTQIGLSSIVSRSKILTQVPIPLEIPPISASVTSLIMLTFEMMVFGVFIVAFHFLPPSTIIILPLVIIAEFVLVTGLSLVLSVTNIRFKDTQFIWNIILQIGFFLSPIFYKMDILPKQVQPILVLNPMVEILNMARDVTLYNKIPAINDVAIMFGVISVIFGISYVIFRVMKQRIIEEL